MLHHLGSCVSTLPLRTSGCHQELIKGQREYECLIPKVGLFLLHLEKEQFPQIQQGQTGRVETGTC